MAYIQPMVQVYQEYAKTTTTTGTADLFPVIIGPCRHIIDIDEDAALALVGAFDAATGMIDASFPNNAAGAIIDKGSVVFRMKNARVRIAAEIAVNTTATKDNKLVLQEAQLPEGLEAGDIIPVGGVEYRITGIEVSAGVATLSLHRNIKGSVPEEVEAWRIVSEYEFRAVSDAGTPAEGVTIDVAGEKFSIASCVIPKVNAFDADGNITHTFEDCKVMSAELYCGYSALRQDLTDIGTINSVGEITGRLGKIVPENPLAFGVNVCLANTNTAVRFIGVASDDLAGYTAAKDRLESYDPIYAIVPLTQDQGILSVFKQHAVAMSEPEESRWRICIGSCVLPEEAVRASGLCYVGDDGDGDRVVVYGAEAPEPDDKLEFLSNSVTPGDRFVIIDGSGIEHVHTVSSVDSEDMLSLTQVNALDKDVFTAGASSTYRFRIEHKLDRTEQANAIAAISASMGEKRYVNVWPDVCIIDGRKLPGYYLSCAVAGGVGGLASQYGFTNLSMAGITGVIHSNDTFNKDQLNIIAGGGTFIFVQDSPESVPYVRHQLTTDMSATEFRELSFVKNFDYVCYICRDAMKPYIGKWNVTESLLTDVKTTLCGTLETLKLAAQPKIGSPVLNYGEIRVEHLDDVRDRIEVYADVTFPYPLNTIGLHIVSQ